MQKISNEIEEKFNLIKNIDNNINFMKGELINCNTLSFQNLKLRKYILANNAEIGIEDCDSNFFLTEEEINDIILDNIDISQNEEIIKLKRDIEINKASEKVIINNYNEINSKIAQIQENLKMLKEEKITTKNELINLISCKESLESIIKLNINQLNIHNNKDKNQDNDMNNVNINDNEEIINNKWTEPNQLYMYELELINSDKAAKLICKQLFNVFGIIDEEDSNNNKNSKLNDNKITKNKSNDFMINSYSINNDDYNSLNYNNKQKNFDETFNNYNTINNSKSFYYQNSIVSPYIINKNKKYEINNNL